MVAPQQGGDPFSIATTLAAAGRADPGIAQFLTTGAYSALSPNARMLVDRTLRGTSWDGRPGQFFVDFMAANQQQAQANKQAGYNPSREVHQNYAQSDPGGGGGAPQAAAPPQSPAPYTPVNPTGAGNAPPNPYAPGAGAPVQAAPGGVPNAPRPTPGLPATGSGSTVTGTPQPGQAGYGGFFNMNNPQQAIRDYMNAQFGAGAADSNMFFGDWIRKFLGNIIPAVMQTTVDANGQPAIDRLDNLQGVLNPLLMGGAGTAAGNLAGHADQAQAALLGRMPGMSANTQADLLRSLTALRTIGQNPYMAESTNNRLDSAIGSAQDYASGIIRNGGQMPTNFSLWDYIQTQLPSGYTNPFQ